MVQRSQTIAGVADVLHRQVFGCLAVMGCQGLVDGAVLCQRTGGTFCIGKAGAAETLQTVMQRGEGIRQHGAAAITVQCTVEIGIQPVQLFRFAFGGIDLLQIHNILKRLQLVFRNAQSAPAGGKPFDTHTDLIDIQHILHRNARHHRTAVGLHRNKAGGFQPTHGLAHRRAGNLIFFTQTQLGERIAGTTHTVEDLLFQGAEHLFRQRIFHSRLLYPTGGQAPPQDSLAAA